MEYGVVLRWWLLYQVLLVAGVPLSARLLPDAPDHGASVAMPLSFVVLAVATLWVGQVAFSQLVVVGVAVAYLAVAAWLARGGVEVNARAFAEVVAVFTVAFAFLIAVRAAADGVHPYGGEKFLDFGILQSLLRADRLPPKDMWFAGERVLYYYGGHLMAAIGAHLTGTEGRFAYSPALAGFYAMAVTGAYGLASTIAANAYRLGDRASYVTAIGVALGVFAVVLLALGVPWWTVAPPAAAAVLVLTRSPRVRAGVLAAFLWGFASNLVTPVRLLASEFGVVRAAVAAAGMRPGREPTVTPETFNMWDASRVLENGINEFPLFAFVNADLHGHMMSVPVLFAVVGVCLGYYRTPGEQRWRRRGLLLCVPVLAGAILAVNAWSYPTVFGITALTVILADAPPRTLLPEWVAARLGDSAGVVGEGRRIVVALTVVVGLAVAGVAVAWPFVWNVLLVSAGKQHPAFLPMNTKLGSFILVHGVFLVAFGTYLLARVARSWTDWAAAGVAAVALVAFGASFDLVVAGMALDTLAVSLAGPLLVGAWLLRRRGDVGFEGILVVAGAGLVVLIEYVYLNDSASGGRFNTIFKTYAQVWGLWSVAGGVALASLSARSPDVERVREAAGTTLMVLLVVSTSVYGALGLATDFSQMDEPTIDAMEHVHDERPGEAAAIEWLLDKPGQPHLASAPGLEPYSWQNPASSLTGIPTVVGWVQEISYRGRDAYETRVTDVGIIFETQEARSRAVLLRKHDVQYIWVGPIERERYDVARMVDEPGISPAFRNAAVTVYAVNQSALTETKNE